MRWGDHLELSEEAGAGDFIYVPPYVPHQEINGSPNEICEAVVVRSGQEPVVINLDVETPEPASAGHPGMAIPSRRLTPLLKLPSLFATNEETERQERRDQDRL